MAWKINEERRKEIVNAIADITTRLKKFDEVECIAWNSEKDKTLCINFLDVISGNTWEDHNSKTGNILHFSIILKNREKSTELAKAIRKIDSDYNDYKTLKQTGIDVHILSLPSYYFRLYSDEDKAMISKLYTMKFKTDVECQREDIIKFLNEEVYKGSKVIDGMQMTSYIKGPQKLVPVPLGLLIDTAFDDVYKFSRWPRLMHGYNIVYDKTPDNYYSRVFNQFEGYKDYYVRETNPKKPLYSLALDLNIAEEVKLRLENTNK